ncbi:MAG: helix-turn-helix domain-containing protein [Steroidobacterales bacterium]
MNQPSESTGTQLRRERERQGLTVQKVADDLRLDRAVVEALEDDSYERSVPVVYARGHLRKYSRLLGLSLDEGQAAQPPPANVEPPPPMRQATRPMRIAPRARTLPWKQISVAAAIVLVLLLFWWSPWKHRVAVQAPTAQGVPASAVEDNAIASVATGTTTSDLVAEPAAVAPAAPAADSPTDVASAGHVNLRLTFTGTSWIDVRDASGRRLFAGHGRAGTVKTLAGRAPLRVHLGLASAVQVELNGHEVPVGPALVRGNVAHFLAGADGLLHPVGGNARTRD